MSWFRRKKDSVEEPLPADAGTPAPAEVPEGKTVEYEGPATRLFDDAKVEIAGTFLKRRGILTDARVGAEISLEHLERHQYRA